MWDSLTSISFGWLKPLTFAMGDGSDGCLEVVGLHGGPLALRVKPQMLGREVRQMLVEQLGWKKGAMTGGLEWVISGGPQISSEL